MYADPAANSFDVYHTSIESIRPQVQRSHKNAHPVPTLAVQYYIMRTRWLMRPPVPSHRSPVPPPLHFSRMIPTHKSRTRHSAAVRGKTKNSTTEHNIMIIVAVYASYALLRGYHCHGRRRYIILYCCIQGDATEHAHDLFFLFFYSALIQIVIFGTYWSATFLNTMLYL